MKTLKIQNMFFVLMMILICGSISWLATMELRKENSLLQTELEGRKKANEQERDSLQSQLDSIRTYFSARLDSVARSHEKSIEANIKSQKEIKILRGIVFVQHTDSSRNSELINLYPSFKP